MGAAIPVSPISGKPWTPAEKQKLLLLWDRYRGKPGGVERLARKFGRTPRAVSFEANQLGLHRNADGKAYLSLTDISRLFGRALSGVWKQFADTGSRNYRRHCIAVDDLWAWMEQPRTWHLWEPETLTDLAWREHFTELRRGWLSTPDVCRVYGVNPTQVYRWRKRGLVKHVGSKRERFHWQADIDRLRERDA